MREQPRESYRQLQGEDDGSEADRIEGRIQVTERTKEHLPIRYPQRVYRKDVEAVFSGVLKRYQDGLPVLGEIQGTLKRIVRV